MGTERAHRGEREERGSLYFSVLVNEEEEKKHADSLNGPFLDITAPHNLSSTPWILVTTLDGSLRTSRFKVSSLTTRTTILSRGLDHSIKDFHCSINDDLVHLCPFIPPKTGNMAKTRTVHWEGPRRPQWSFKSSKTLLVATDATANEPRVIYLLKVQLDTGKVGLETKQDS